MAKISFQTLWRLVKIIAIVQIFNAVMDYFMWVQYGYLVPSWTIATLSVFYTVLILALKRAQENEANPLPKNKPSSKGLKLKSTCSNTQESTLKQPHTIINTTTIKK